MQKPLLAQTFELLFVLGLDPMTKKAGAPPAQILPKAAPGLVYDRKLFPEHP